MARPRFMPRHLTVAETEPFSSAEEAWIWYAHCQVARLAGCRPRADMAAIARPCDPDDIYRETMRLHRLGLLESRHLRVLAQIGTRIAAANTVQAPSRGEEIIWTEALGRLETSFRSKGIVA